MYHRNKHVNTMRRSSSLTVNNVGSDHTLINIERRYSTSFFKLDKQKPHRALRTLFLRNQDRHFGGVVLPISVKLYREFQILLEAVTQALSPHVLLTSAVSKLYRIDGTPIQSLDDFYNRDVVICCCDYEAFIKINYNVDSCKVEQLVKRICRHKRKERIEIDPHIKVQDLPKMFRSYFNISGPIWQKNCTIIFKADSSISKKPFIIKAVNMKSMCMQAGYCYIEVDILRKLQGHPNILELCATVERSDFTFIMTERLDSDLYNLVKTYSPIGQDTIKRIIGDTTRGLLYMHSHQIIHRDLKPENLLAQLSFDSLGNNPQVFRVKIADFGLATYYVGSELKQWCGTPPYMAPELISYAGYDFFVDSWALGCTLYFLLFGRLPFDGQGCKDHTIYDCVEKCQYQIPLDQMNKINTNAEQLMNSLLVKSPQLRLSAREISSHPFLC